MGEIQETILMIIECRNQATDELEKVHGHLSKIAGMFDTIRTAMGRGAGDADAAAARYIQSFDKANTHAGTLRTSVESISTTTGKLRAQAESDLTGIEASFKTHGANVESITQSFFGNAYLTKAMATGAPPVHPMPGVISGNAVGEFGPAGGEEAAGVAAAMAKADAAKSQARKSVLTGAAVVGGAADAGVGMIIKGALDNAAKFQELVQNMAGEAQIPVDVANKIGTAFMHNFDTMGFSTDEMISSFGNLAGELQNQLGPQAMSVAGSTQIMNQAMDLSKATGVGLQQGLSDTLNTMKALHLVVTDAKTGQIDFAKTMDNMTTANDVFANVSAKTGLPLQQINMELQRMSPALQASGMSVQEAGGLILQFNQQLGSGRQSTQAMIQAVQGLQNTAMKGSIQIGNQTLKLTDANGKYIGYAKSIDMISAAMAKSTGHATMNQKQQDALTQAIQKNSMSLAAAKTHLEDLELKAQSSGGATGALKQQIDAAQKTVDGLSMSLDNNEKKLAAGQGKMSSYQEIQKLFGKNADAIWPIIQKGSAGLEASAAAADKAGAAHEMAATKSDTLKDQQEKLHKELNAASTDIGVALLPAATAYASKLAELAGGVADFTQKHQTATKVILGVVAALGGMMILAKVISMVKETVGVFKSMVPGASEAAGSAKAQQKAIENLTGAITKMSKTIPEAMSTATESMKAFTGEVGKVKSAMEALPSAAEGASTSLGGFAEANNAVSEAISGHSSLPAIQQVTEAMDAMSTAAERASSASEGLAVAQDGVATASEATAPALEGATVAEDGLNVAVDANPFMAIIPIMMMVATVVVPLIISHFSQIKSFFIGLWNDIKGIFVTVWDFIKNHLQVILTIILGIIMGPFGILLAYIVTHLSQVKQFFINAWNDIKDFFTKTIPGIVDSIVGFFAALPGRLAGALGNMGKWVWDHAIKPAFDFLIGLIGTYIGLLVDVYVKLPVKIVTGLAGFAVKIWNFLSGELGAVANNISGWIGGIAGFFTGLPGKIIDALKTVAKDFDKIGKNILDAIMNGIKNAGGDIKNILGSVPILGPILSAGGGVVGSILSHLDAGGTIAQSGVAVVHKGEFVGQPEVLAREAFGMGGGGSVYIDMSNSLVDRNVVDALIARMGSRMATHTLPASGYRNL